MTLEQAIEKAKNGKTVMLPGFTGYFNWSYAENKLIFSNGNWRSDIENLDIKNRTDFYYII